MNPTVIKAALTAWYWLEKPEEHETAEDVEERMDAAISAAMVALAPDIRAAVDRLEQAATDWKDVDEGGTGFEIAAASSAVRDARRDLFALLGIEG